ncbi:NAD-dependent epimerase/dehydratase family protein [Yersinia aldovae]|uniref:NAD-dependent epimerase/dehydratase family protein n=1 Tax=Yersinia aldovae TaxID=29483 RepID=UPI00119D3EB3|nr:GDP-mannose 4,6-dehydratase [Yersinia aldovae]
MLAKDSKRALITGISGFTGQYMASELTDAGYTIFGLSTKSSPNPNYYQADLLDPLFIRKIIEEVQPHVVIHLAAIAFVDHPNPNEFYKVNVIGSRNLLAALSDIGNNVEAILLASSANIYGNAVGGTLNEMNNANPANDYAVSKLAMELMAKLWMGKLPIIITRPFNYIGIGQSESFLVPKIVSHFKHRTPTIELGNLDVWRDFTDVRLLVKAYHLLLNNKKSIGEVFNICSGKAYCLRDIISICEKETSHKLKIHVNQNLIRANEIKILQGDVSKLHSIIGDWNNVELEDTLRWMLSA